MRRKMILTVDKIDTTDPTEYQGPASFVTFSVLRPGAVLKTTTNMSDLTNGPLEDIENPGGIIVGDYCHLQSSDVVDTDTKLRVDTVSFAAGVWEITVTNQSGKTVSWSEGDKLVLINDFALYPGHFIDVYEDDTSSTTVSNPVTLGQTAMFQGYVDSTLDVDVAVSGAGVITTYYTDLSTDDRAEVNVKEFGATGDGTTDDTVAIAAAFDYAGINPGKVFFPYGTYIVDGTQFTLVGGMVVSGYGATLKLKADTYNAQVHFLGTRTNVAYDAGEDWQEKILIEGLTFDGNISNVTTSDSSSVIVGHQVRDMVVRDCIIKDMPGETGGGYGVSFWYSDRVTVDNCRVDRTDRQNVLVWETTSANIVNCNLKDSYYRGNILVSSFTPKTLQASDATITGCNLSNALSGGSLSNYGIRFSGESGGSIYGGSVTATDECIFVVDTPDKIKVTIDGVRVYGGTYGVRSSSDQDQRLFVTNNVIEDNTIGLHVSSANGFVSCIGNYIKGSTGSTFTISFVDELIFSKNLVDGGTSGVLKATDWGVFTENIITNCTTATGAVQLQTNGTPFYQVANNIISGNTSDLIDSVSASGVFHLSGTGSPEGVHEAPVGSTYNRTDNANAFYIKQTGTTTSTGWVLK